MKVSYSVMWSKEAEALTAVCLTLKSWWQIGTVGRQRVVSSRRTEPLRQRKRRVMSVVVLGRTSIGPGMTAVSMSVSRRGSRRPSQGSTTPLKFWV